MISRRCHAEPADNPPAGPSADGGYWPDLGEFAELYSLGWPLLAIRLDFILPLLTIRVVPAITVRDPAIAVRVGSILVSDTYWF